MRGEAAAILQGIWYHPPFRHLTLLAGVSPRNDTEMLAKLLNPPFHSSAAEPIIMLLRFALAVFLPLIALPIIKSAPMSVRVCHGVCSHDG